MITRNAFEPSAPRPTRRALQLLACAAVAAAAAACAHKPATDQGAAPPDAAPSGAAARSAPKPEEPAPLPPVAADARCSGDADCVSNQLCVGSRCRAVSAALVECRPTVHFDFDRADLKPSDQAALQRAVRCLLADRKLAVVVEGNCDERGTVEYNLALGDRRAHAVEKYLRALGVAQPQLRTVSYGEERPICTEHDEACWARNRRGDLTRDDAASPQAQR